MLSLEDQSVKWQVDACLVGCGRGPQRVEEVDFVFSVADEWLKPAVSSDLANDDVQIDARHLKKDFLNSTRADETNAAAAVHPSILKLVNQDATALNLLSSGTSELTLGQPQTTLSRIPWSL